jgi:hypothetical protein
MRIFETGGTRDDDTHKLDYEGFLSPEVLKRFAEYMNSNRVQADGALRASDNWQRGMPKDAYMKSGWRHFLDWWSLHRNIDNEVELEDAICAVIFNAQGYLYELLQEKKDGK